MTNDGHCSLEIVVQIPTFFTGHMSYDVDIGWPVGLVVVLSDINNAATATHLLSAPAATIVRVRIYYSPRPTQAARRRLCAPRRFF